MRTVRIAVNNLAGVPSIVFGVFGLGFFVYFVGRRHRPLFFPEALPTPTFGTGGILWASLTLALLTVPVVIVAVRGGAGRGAALDARGVAGHGRHQVPDDPARGPARGGAGDPDRPDPGHGPRGGRGGARSCSPGWSSSPPSCPLDGFFPFLHLDRKFMHLGFHIYDVGFQSPNVEAAKPMVYTTTIFLLVIVVLLNLTAIIVRNRLREKYKTGAF